MVKPEDMERYLTDQIEEIRRRAEAEIKPYFDQLIELRNLQPPRITLLNLAELREASGIDEIGKRKLIP